MDERLVTDDGAEIVFLPRTRGQSIRESLAGNTFEVFDHDCFDFNILKPVPLLRMRWNLSVRTWNYLFATLRFFLANATLTIITNQAATFASQETIDRIGQQTFLAISYVMQFGNVPFLLAVVLQFNNFFAEMIYYKYLGCGAIIDFPDTSSRSFLCHHRLPLLFLIGFCCYSVFTIATLFALGSPASHFVVVFSSLAGVMNFWYNLQGVEDKLISLTEYIQSFPDGSGEYGNIDENSLVESSAELKKLILLEGRQPSYDGYWRRSYFKSIYAETKIRVGLGFLVKAVIVCLMAGVVCYSLFLLSLRDEKTWADVINPCVTACVYDDKLGHASSDRCSVCLCRCLSSMHMRLCNCLTRLSVSNCSVATVPSLCTCSADPSVQCLS